MLLHANPVNVADSLPRPADVPAETSYADVGQPWSADSLPSTHSRPPAAFKANSKAGSSSADRPALQADGSYPSSIPATNSSAQLASSSSNGSKPRLAPLGASASVASAAATAAASALGPETDAHAHQQAHKSRKQQQAQQQGGTSHDAGPANSVSKQSSGSHSAGLQAAAHGVPAPVRYQTAHHSLVPRTGHNSAVLSQRRGRVGKLRVGSAGQTAALTKTSALLQRAGVTTEQDDLAVQTMQWDAAALKLGGGPGAWGGASSIGDLEALDTILDQLVVLDARMREALLRGPQISFTTVVSDQAAMSGLMAEPAQDDGPDRTFLTAVRGVVEQGHEDAEDPSDNQQPQQPLPAHNPASRAAAIYDDSCTSRQPQTALTSDPAGRIQWGGASQVAAPQRVASDDPALVAAYHGGIPVPILPKLARMYISSKQTAAVKAAPPPPPTAAWLLRTRLPHPDAQPVANTHAPSYDSLVSQIKDVQRQYTCGTAPDKSVIAADVARSPGPPRTNLEAYISGLDGPLLPDVVAPQLGPSALERARPSFVSMSRATHSARRAASKELQVRQEVHSSSGGALGGVSAGGATSDGYITGSNNNSRGPSPARRHVQP